MAIRTGLRTLQRVLAKTVDNLNGRNTGKIVILFINTLQDFIDVVQVIIEAFSPKRIYTLLHLQQHDSISNMYTSCIVKHP